MTLDKILRTLVDTGAWKATYFQSPKEIIRMTVIGKRFKSRGNNDLHVTVGRPNYAERQYVKVLKKAKEPFPVKKLWLKYPPKKGKK